MAEVFGIIVIILIVAVAVAAALVGLGLAFLVFYAALCAPIGVAKRNK